MKIRVNSLKFNKKEPQILMHGFSNNKKYDNLKPGINELVNIESGERRIIQVKEFEIMEDGGKKYFLISI